MRASGARAVGANGAAREHPSKWINKHVLKLLAPWAKHPAMSLFCIALVFRRRLQATDSTNVQAIQGNVWACSDSAQTNMLHESDASLQTLAYLHGV